MKKLISLLLALGFITISLVSCGTKSENQTSTESSTSQIETTQIKSDSTSTTTSKPEISQEPLENSESDYLSTSVYTNKTGVSLSESEINEIDKLIKKFSDCYSAGDALGIMEVTASVELITTVIQSIESELKYVEDDDVEFSKSEMVSYWHSLEPSYENYQNTYYSFLWHIGSYEEFKKCSELYKSSEIKLPYLYEKYDVELPFTYKLCNELDNDYKEYYLKKINQKLQANGLDDEIDKVVSLKNTENRMLRGEEYEMQLKSGEIVKADSNLFRDIYRGVGDYSVYAYHFSKSNKWYLDCNSAIFDNFLNPDFFTHFFEE